MSQGAEGSTSTSKRRVYWWVVAGLMAVAVVLWVRHDGPVVVDRIELKPGALAGWNVLLVSMDTTRRDRLHCYGRDEIDTPVIDGLAREGIRFDQAITSVPMTLPSHATMLTGLYPQHHGARVNGMFRLDEQVATLQGTLRMQGYRTGAAIAAFVLDRRFGLDRGFDQYNDDLSVGRKPYQFSFRERPAEYVNMAATAWLRKNADRPFFLFVHYFDPHWPYEAPEPFGSRYKNNHYGDYDGEIAYTDDQIGQLLAVLDELKVRDRTLIIVTSDHGEGLGEHNENTHAVLVYDATLRVPLIFSGPRPLPRRRLVTRQVGLVDLMPTVLDLLGVAIPPGLDGVSLLDPPNPGPRPLYIESLGSKFLHGWAPLMGVRRGDFKFVLAPKSELFDLRADPKELRNLLSSDRATASALYETLKEMVGGDPQLAADVPANLPMDRETRIKLDALGYVQTATAPATTPSTSQRTELPDPKDMILAQKWVMQAQTMISKGQFPEALLLLEPYIEKYSGDPMALSAAGMCYRALGKLDKSLDMFLRATRMDYRRAEAYAGLAGTLLMQNKLEQAEAACLQGLETDASSMSVLLALGSVRARQKRDKEAIALFERVIRESRGTYDAQAYVCLSKLHLGRGRMTEAREALDKALAVEASHPAALDLLAKLAGTQEDKEAAMAGLRARVETGPRPELLLHLGRLEAQKGDYEQAEKTLRNSLNMQSDSAEAHYELARVLQKLGKDDEATLHLRETLRLAPKNGEALTDLGMALAKQKRLDEARDAFERAVLLAPKSAKYRYNLGIILVRLGRLAQAVEEFRRTIEIDPDHARAHYNLGQVLRAQGLAAEADKHLRRAIELDPKLSQVQKGASPATTP